MAVPVFDAQNAGGGASTSSVSFSVTVGSGASMFACLSRGNNTAVSTCTWNTSESLSAVDSATEATNGATAFFRYLSNPTSGTHTFAASWSGNSNTGAGVLTYTGIDTGGTPYGTMSKWSATSGNPSGVDVSSQLGTTGIAVEFCATNGNASCAVTTTGSNSTERFNKAPADLGGGWFAFAGGDDTDGTPSWTIAAGDSRVAFAIPIFAAGGGGGGGMLARFTWPGGIGRPIGAMVGGFDG